jgi:hypothetical protein
MSPSTLLGWSVVTRRGCGRGDDDVWVVLHTGGTTAFPKGVKITHRNFLTMALGSLATYPWVTLEGRMLRCPRAATQPAEWARNESPCRHARLSPRGQAVPRRNLSGGRSGLRSRPPSCWASIIFV